MDNIFGSLWNMLITLIEYVSIVWDWLSNPLKVDIPLLSNLPLIGSWFNISLSWSPIELLGGGILVLLGLWIVKNLIPLG